MKVCTNCNTPKELSLFYKRSSSSDGFSPHCKSCDNEKRREWRKNNPVKQQQANRSRQLLKRYGMTLLDYETLFEKQGCRCGICGTMENYSGNTGPRKEWSFSVDHCHETGTIRGLLCNDCNRALGLFRDDKSLLEKAIAWLDTKDVA